MKEFKSKKNLSKDQVSVSQKKVAQRSVSKLSSNSNIHNSSQSVHQRLVNNSSKVRQLKSIQQLANNVIQKKSNNSNLPTQLKSGIENLSGISMDDVKVHYNSSKPAQLQAHAYAQGTNIHLGPGQEKHLPHEAWHVVQQKQGRVKPTMQMKRKVNINDDKGLEREADVMGGKAANGIITTINQLRTISQASNLVQKITNKEALKSSQNEELIWFHNGEKYVQARIIHNIGATKEKVNIRLMDGSLKRKVLLTELRLKNPNDPTEHAVGIKGINTPGPSKPVDGQNVIHKGIVETEMVNGMPHVRVYSGLMSSVSFDSENEQTGEATSAYKDVHQTQDGKITISSGNNSLLWAGMGRPLRVLKWSEKYFAQILHEKPDLKSLYVKYKAAVSDIETQNKIIENLNITIDRENKRLKSNTTSWTGRGKSPSKKQQRSLQLLATKIEGHQKEVKQANDRIKKNALVVKNAKTILGKDANPVIRSFLIPFSSYEKISKRAIPEELNTVFSQGEDAYKIINLAKTTMEKVDLYLKLKSKESQIYSVKFAEAQKLSKRKRLTAKQRKRSDLRYKQAEKAKKEVIRYEKLIVAEFHKFDLAMNPDKKDKTSIKNHEVKGKVEAIFKSESKKILGLAKKSMPDLDVSNITPTGIIEAMKRRGLDTRSINVDRHYEPNQFGIKGPDIDMLRADALPGSLNTYAMFPNDMDKTRKAESGKVQHANVLRERLGIPKEELSESPWLQGSDFAKQKKFEGEANMLSMYYSTWLKSKNSKFDESSLLAPSKAQIPLKNRIDMLNKFLKENKIPHDKINDFMSNVVGPWASQSMIAHIMADDYDHMNKDQNIVKKTSGQDFAKMRYDLPERRSKLKSTGKALDFKIRQNASPKELIDKLIKDFPELKNRYSKISAKSESFTFYDHAQMVYQQFERLSHNDDDGQRLMSKALIGKMILFHDMEKWNSKEQYGREGEHKLTIDEMNNYKELWGNNKNAEIAKTLVNSDPFGEYMKGKITREEAHAEITGLAEKLGFKPAQYTQFFREYHQFFQADFSSYTDRVEYTTMEGTKVTGKPVFNKYFNMNGRRGKMARRKKGKTKGRFIYSKGKANDLHRYEAKFLALQKLFA